MLPTAAVALLLAYKVAMHIGRLARNETPALKGCGNVAELSIGLLTCLKLCGREFNSHCGICGYSEVSGVDIIAS